MAGLMLVPVIMGVILDKTNHGISVEAVQAGEAAYDYKFTILFLAILGLIGLIFAILLKREDKTSGHGLELPNKLKV